MSIIGSAVFVYHSIGLYSMCVIGSAHLICHSAIFAYHSIGLSSIPPFLRTIQLVYTACSLCKKLIYRTGSAVFTHHSICLSSVPPFLRTIQWHYTACRWSLYRYRVWDDRQILSHHSISHSAIFAYHLIGLLSVSPFLRTIQLAYTACSLCKKLIYRIGSAVFTHHSICLSSIPPFLHMSAAYTALSTLYSMCVIGSAVWNRFCHSAIFLRTIQLTYTASLYRYRVWCDLTNVGIKIHLSDRLCRFTHHSICLSSIPPFLHMSAACGCVPWSQIPSRYMTRTMDSPHLKYHHVTRPEP